SDTLKAVSSADSVITFTVRRNHDIDLTTLQPQLTLTPGATVEQIVSEVDSEQGGYINYRVTSENRLWHRNYTIALTPVVRTVSDTVDFDFEHFELETREQKYYIWHNVNLDGTLGNDWANGNPGFRLSMGSATPEEYPSVPLAQGYEGYGIQLTTRSTGPFGALAGKRLAAGNFFLGTFDVTNALKDALHATSFGVPFDRAPVTLTGYYKYQPGPTYQDKDGNAVSGQTDQAAIYAVLYRNHDAEGNTLTLHGDDVKTSAQIVAIADMGTVTPSQEWTAFSLSFNYKSDIDYELLENQGYSLAIVFSSSSEGDKFEGAIGSQLCIDKVRVLCKKEQ
ncbi:MAG: PCMD domain-containing protein, partial [Prevotella sp.]|nr:PCMD domain-containing protein [Prevotella sp.]